MSTGQKNESRYDIMHLLSELLPLNLPTVEKDLLILMAAYYGNIERYVKLRRPTMILWELNCCVHGIYHNTMIAIWWSKQEPANHDRAIEQAIKAGFVMNDVLAPITAEDDANSLPTLISHPKVATEATYHALAKYKPAMVPYMLEACIMGRMYGLFYRTSKECERTRLSESRQAKNHGSMVSRCNEQTHEAIQRYAGRV